MLLLDKTPTIKLTLEKSDDLVDTVFQMFTEGFGSHSRWIRKSDTIYGVTHNGVRDTDFKEHYYTVVSDENLFSEIEEMARMAKLHDAEKYHKLIKKLSEG